MSAQEKLYSQSYQQFAQYVRDWVLEVSQEKEGRRLFGDAGDAVFLQALNAYLLSEGQPEIAKEQLAQLPENFAFKVAQGLDMPVLNKQPNVFNMGDDMQTRVPSRRRNAALASFYHALADYQLTQAAPVIAAVREFQRAQIDADHQAPALWKMHIEQSADGSLKRELKRVDQIDFSKKVVICVGGVNSVGLHGQELAGMIKQAENLLGGKEIYSNPETQGKMAFYSISHPVDYRIRLNGYSIEYNADPEHYFTPYTMQVFNAYFRPLLMEAVEQDSQAHSLVHSKAALRHLNFFSSSYGSAFTKTLCNAITMFYQEQGYDAGQIKQLLPEVFSLNINPAARLDDEKPSGNFSSIYVVSKNDMSVRSRSHPERLVDDPDTPQIVPIADNELMIWSDRPQQGVVLDLINQAMDYHSGKAGKTTQQLTVGDSTGHNVKIATSDTYIHAQDGSDATVTIHKQPEGIANALRNAVMTQGSLGSVMDMLKKPASLFKSKYVNQLPWVQRMKPPQPANDDPPQRER